MKVGSLLHQSTVVLKPTNTTDLDNCLLLYCFKFFLVWLEQEITLDKWRITLVPSVITLVPSVICPLWLGVSTDHFSCLRKCLDPALTRDTPVITPRTLRGGEWTEIYDGLLCQDESPVCPVW